MSLMTIVRMMMTVDACATNPVFLSLPLCLGGLSYMGGLSYLGVVSYLGGLTEAHSVEYYERFYPDLFKRDLRHLYANVDHRKYFCNCNMHKDADPFAPNQQQTKPQNVASLAMSLDKTRSNKSAVGVFELDASQMDELLLQNSGDSKSRRSSSFHRNPHLFVALCVGALLVFIFVIAMVISACFLWRRIRRKSSASAAASSSSSPSPLHRFHPRLPLQLSHPPHHHQHQQHQHPQQLQRSFAVASPLGPNDYKLTDLGGCPRNGDDIFYPTAYGYNFHFSRQRFPPSTGKKDGAEGRSTWSGTHHGARSSRDVQEVDRKPDYSEVVMESRYCEEKSSPTETDPIVKSEKTTTVSCYQSFDNSKIN